MTKIIVRVDPLTKQELEEFAKKYTPEEWKKLIDYFSTDPLSEAIAQFLYSCITKGIEEAIIDVISVNTEMCC